MRKLLGLVGLGAAITYFFHPLKGTPKNLDRSAPPVRVAVQTEPLFTDGPARRLLQPRGAQQPGIPTQVRGVTPPT